jgi:glycosyltransferase involved in cell wall biosynthesis
MNPLTVPDPENPSSLEPKKGRDSRAWDLEAEVAWLRAEVERRERQIEEIVCSTSWRITTPLRSAGRVTRHVASGLGPHPGSPLWRALRRVYRALPLRGETKARWIGYLVSRGFLRPAPNGLPSQGKRVEVERTQQPWPTDRPLVSFVIPSFNYGRFVGEAVDSILAQTFGDLEILVVDGGSTDGETREVLTRLGRPKTEIFLREGRFLVGDNRNYGIARARGKYIACLDADDRIRSTFLEKALFLLETQGYDMVSTALESCGSENRVYSVTRYPSLADIVHSNQVPNCVVFRRELWEASGGFVDSGLGTEYIHEDWRLWMRFAALGARIANLVEEPLFLYRVHRASLSHMAGNRPIASHREAIIEVNRDLLTPEAYQRSEAERSLRVRIDEPLLNLRARDPRDDRRTVLFAVPFLIVGGAERLLGLIAAELAHRGYRLIVISTVYVDPSFGDCTDWLLPATAEIYHLPRFLEPDLWKDFILSQIAIKRVEVLWLLGSAFFYHLLPEIKAAYPELQVVDQLFNTAVHAKSNRHRQQQIDLTLVENREVQDWLLKHGERPERMRLIESGVDLELCRPRSEKSPQLLAKLDIPPEAFIVGFSGRLSEEKSPESFLDLAAALRDEPNFYFLMTGAGPLVDEVRRRFLRLGLRRRFHFLGRVEDVHSYLAIYDALILPSRFDGRPVVVLESLAMGVPVIASRVGALPELVREGETGFLCKPGDVRAFAERVRWLAAHPEDHRRMRLAARAYAEEHLDARRMLEAYAGAVGELMDAAVPAGRGFPLQAPDRAAGEPRSPAP